MALPTTKKWFDDALNSSKATVPSMLQSPYTWDLSCSSNGMRFSMSVEVERSGANKNSPVLSVAKALVVQKMLELKAELALLKECGLDVTNMNAACGKTVYGMVVRDEKLSLD